MWGRRIFEHDNEFKYLPTRGNTISDSRFFGIGRYYAETLDEFERRAC